MSIQKNKFSTTQLLKNFLSPKKTKLIVISVLLFFAILSLPEPIMEAGSGLDPSWRIGIHLAKRNDLIWGTQVVFTYGPLGYLSYPINIDGSLWTNSFFYQIMKHVLFFLVIGIFSLKTKFPIITAITLGIYSVFLTDIQLLVPFEFQLIGIFLGFYLYLEYTKKFILIIPLAFVSAFSFFVKGDVGFGAASILVLSCIVLLTQKRVKEVVICLTSYISFLIIIWLGMNYSITQFFAYLTNQSHIVSGYAAAMSNEWEQPLIILAILGWALYFWWIIEATRKNRRNLQFLFISAGIFYINFRLGFVREEGHFILFFHFLATLFLIYFFSDKSIKRNNFLKYSTLVMIVVIIFSANWAFAGMVGPRIFGPLDPVEVWVLSLDILGQPYKKMEFFNYPKYVQLRLLMWYKAISR